MRKVPGNRKLKFIRELTEEDLKLKNSPETGFLRESRVWRSALLTGRRLERNARTTKNDTGHKPSALISQGRNLTGLLGISEKLNNN